MGLHIFVLNCVVGESKTIPLVGVNKKVHKACFSTGVGNVFFPVCQVVKFNVKIYVCVPMSSLRFYLRFPYFSPKIRMFSKKKRSSLRFHLQFPYFSPKIRMFSKKKKGLHFDFMSDFPIFLPKSG